MSPGGNCEAWSIKRLGLVNLRVRFKLTEVDRDGNEIKSETQIEDGKSRKCEDKTADVNGGEREELSDDEKDVGGGKEDSVRKFSVTQSPKFTSLPQPTFGRFESEFPEDAHVVISPMHNVDLTRLDEIESQIEVCIYVWMDWIDGWMDR